MRYKSVSQEEMCTRGFSGDVESIEIPSADIDIPPQALARKQIGPQYVFPETTSLNPGVVESVSPWNLITNQSPLPFSASSEWRCQESKVCAIPSS